jgi:aspartyl protease family protein
MREAVFLAVAVLAFVGAAFVPGGAMDSATDSAATLAEAEPRVLHAGAAPASPGGDGYAAWAAGSTELPRAADGHFYADAAINGTSVNFLVDTGATMVALTGADARAAGLYWSDADVGVVARGASGPVYGVSMTLERVTLGGHEARNVSAIVVPEGLGISLLGQSFLQTIQPVRIDSDRMVLGG